MMGKIRIFVPVLLLERYALFIDSVITQQFHSQRMPRKATRV